MGRKLRWCIWGTYVLLWTALLLTPARAINDLPGVDLFQPFRYAAAKSLHVTAYAIMTILCAWLQVSARWRWLLVFFVMAHATLTEHIQQYVPGRTGDLHDVGFDNIGIAIGLALSLKWWTANE
jgi:VanZ family protein